jgi:hypothetical protein
MISPTVGLFEPRRPSPSGFGVCVGLSFLKKLAEDGFPVHPVAAHSWKKGAHLLQGENNPHGGAMLMPDGSAPRAGDVSFSLVA